MDENFSFLTCVRSTSLLCCFRLQENFTLREYRPDSRREQWNAWPCPKQRSPPNRYLRNQEKIDNSRNEITNCISLLEETTRNTTGLNGKIFEGGGRCKTPDAAHSNTKQRAESKELGERLNKTSSEFEDGDEDEVED